MKEFSVLILSIALLSVSISVCAQEIDEKKLKTCFEEARDLSRKACFSREEYRDLLRDLKDEATAKKILEPLEEIRDNKICFDLDKIYRLSDDQRKDLGIAFKKIKKRARVNIERIYSETKRLKALEPKDGYSLCIIAELMKRVGDYDAGDYYEKAIAADDTEPTYELYYADYLRNFRGPQRPLFPEAEEHYFKALRKLRKREIETRQKSCDDETEKEVERGLITLYQEDGFPLLYWESNLIEPRRFLERPFVFFGTINRYARSTTDLDEVDDARDFTSEALFASSGQRLNRALSEDQLRKVIRRKDHFESLNRFRFRYKYWPALDIFYKYKKIDDAQITNFFEPDKFNNVNLNEYGVAIEKPFGLSPYFDFFLKGTFKRVQREGIIEFLPETDEDINHFEAKTAASRFIGPDKANLEFTYVYQDINPDIPNPQTRDRQIFATTFTYQVFRPIPFLQHVYDKRFVTRGIDLFVGFLHDNERFGDVDVDKNDYFAGASFKGLGKFDVILQSTFFTSEVEGDEFQDNSQYRTNLTLLYRIKDEEEVRGIPKRFMGIYPAFVHLVIPVRHDVGIDGPEDFENFKVGVELDVKFFVKASQETRLLGSTFLASLRYDHQRFFRIDKDLDLFSANVSMGF